MFEKPKIEKDTSESGFVRALIVSALIRVYAAGAKDRLAAC